MTPERIVLSCRIAELPGTLSGLLRLGIEASEALALDADYLPDSDIWHDPQQDGLCHACLSGAVFRLLCRNPNPKATFHPYDFLQLLGQPWEKALLTLEILREGRMVDAAFFWKSKIPVQAWWDCQKPPHDRNVYWRGHKAFSDALDELRSRVERLTTVELEHGAYG